MLSAAKVGQLPDNEAEVAIVGRSNVGKSSLLNALANRKALALVSKTPGDSVNLETDIIARYVDQLLNEREPA